MRTTSLFSRNVTVNGHRTSMKLEREMWDALGEICRRERLTASELCSLIDEKRHANTLTAATRVFILSYFRAAATDDGHAKVGHGQGVVAKPRLTPRLVGDARGLLLGAISTT